MRQRQHMISRLCALALTAALGSSGQAPGLALRGQTVYAQEDEEKEETAAAAQADAAVGEETADVAQDWDISVPEIEGLTYSHTQELKYAKCYALHFYENGYAVMDIFGSAKYLIVPDGKPVPKNLDKSLVVLQKPLDHIYLTATSIMALFDALDALDDVTLTGTQSTGWYIDCAKDALAEGTMTFAGKYSEPDYELLLKEGCDLSLQSTMILHTPKVKEMLQDLGIPVLVDYSTNEAHPLGKLEWIRFYGYLTDHEAEAEAFLAAQEEKLAALEDFENTEKTVAYFYINTSGQAVVREVTDSIPAMIEMAGGRYIFTEPISPESGKSTPSITMEEFYNTAVNADYLIYNATIDNPITTVDELLMKSELFADFKAVQEGNVWCTGKSMFQSSDKVVDFIMDLYYMVTDGEERQMTFLTKVQ